ncbi:bna4 [Symbiodinium natans]|uniref:Bna4 protein n=1 Tax=Symbiodinium natans TaxID=878477 RepID=A0A812S324_9DINO|nr:bna4 [Symbiodinium natans]
MEVLEKTGDPASYDPGKGFMYLIDGRGQKCLQQLNPELFTKLVDSSVGMADAKIGVLTPKGLTERVNPIKDAARKSYWIPRHAFVGLLLDEAKQKENISLSVDVAIDDITFDGDEFRVKASTSAAPLEGLSGSLLVAADGYRSDVRDKLEELDGARGHYAVDKRDSPSAGLRYKVLTLPGEFKLDTPAGEKDFSSDGFYAVRGVSARKAKQKLGLIPVRKEFGTRTANLITYEDDVVWEADTLESFKEYAAEQWPHFPLEDLVSEEELARFAQNRGGRFPKPQYCRSAMWLPDDGAQSAAVLIGDALHSLPPDIGQGVNSALQDVTVLASCLDAAGSGGTRGAATAYQDTRMPDVRALIDIVQVAAPFQRLRFV